MKCQNCNSELRKVNVKVYGANSKVISYQCPDCNYFEFDSNSSKKVLEELREPTLKIKQKIVKLSQDRLGVYFNQNVIRSLDLKNGEDVYVSIPDKKHIILELKNEKTE